MKTLLNTFLSLIFVGTLSANIIELHPEYEALLKDNAKVSYTEHAKKDFKRLKKTITKLKKTSTADYVVLVSKFEPVVRDKSVRYFSEDDFEFEEVTAEQVLKVTDKSIEWKSDKSTKKSCLYVKTSNYIKRLEKEHLRKTQEEARKIAARQKAEEWMNKQLAAKRETEEEQDEVGQADCSSIGSDCSYSSPYSGSFESVQGHWRRTKSGKFTWVEGYTRRK
jgi:hypothetical protein